ncbi:hypothetical protein [Rhodococcus sp. 14-2470-1a]|uniref:hypothetical protein n=1 Tax=Rhodococcus sp. 14-2470-1a TaxID=2023150 RepID=UPI00117A2DB7|nr:hypothetical protein [Rhodococcus sp. 14-2470-1a]
MSLKYVDYDGVHHDLIALDQLDIEVVDTAIAGAGFTATTREVEPAASTTVTVTGFIECSSVIEIAGPI